MRYNCSPKPEKVYILARQKEVADLLRGFDHGPVGGCWIKGGCLNTGKLRWQRVTASSMEGGNLLEEGELALFPGGVVLLLLLLQIAGL